MAKRTEVIPSDLYVQGSLSCETFKPPPNCIDNDAIVVDGSNPVDAVKVEQQYPVYYAQNDAADVADEKKIVHVAYAAGQIIAIRILQKGANTGAATTVVDVKKNGTTSVLTATITIDSSYVAGDIIDSVLDTVQKDYVADDYLEVVVDSTLGGGTLGNGLIVWVLLREKPGS